MEEDETAAVVCFFGSVSVGGLDSATRYQDAVALTLHREAAQADVVLRGADTASPERRARRWFGRRTLAGVCEANGCHGRLGLGALRVAYEPPSAL